MASYILSHSLDNKTGHHQICVRFADQDKLAFFGAKGQKYTFSVMLFGPRNAPTFYTSLHDARFSSRV